VSGAGGPDAAREIARGLSQIVVQALADGASVRTLDAARDLALLVSLRGLDRLLNALSPYAGAQWPGVLKPVLEQVRRAAATCGREGNVEPLRRIDDDLARMAQAIERTPLTPDPTTAGHRSQRAAAEAAPVRLVAALEGLAVQRGSDELLANARLHPPVAGALRAALDWLLGEGGAHLRVWLASDGSALEVTCEGVVYSGVHPAAEVLANVGAHIGPAGDRPGAWTMRVPLLGERETFLMVEQGDLQLAVPWHAVSRVRLMPTETIDAMARRQGLPMLAPLAVASRRAAEQPVVVVALGLKRACLVADRLVWRMSAQPTEAPDPRPAAGIGRAVRSDDGDLYWVLDPAWLLREIAAPPVADAGLRIPPPTAVTSVSTPPVAPTLKAPTGPPPPIPFPTAAVQRRTAEAGDEPVRSLSPQDVEPMEATPAEQEPGATPVTAVPREPAATPESTMPAEIVPRATTIPPMKTAPSAPIAPSASAAPPASAAPVESAAPLESVASQPLSAPSGASRQVLLAEDSIIARIFLLRLLEQRGFQVHAVGTAEEFRALLPRGPWALVCADLELPDARGEAFLREALRSAEAVPAPLVALVRDAADETVARAAGVAATLRKPFEREALERVLAALLPDLPRSTGREPAPAPAPAPDPRDWGAR
jgi:CheY-like chemotaxis protein